MASRAASAIQTGRAEPLEARDELLEQSAALARGGARAWVLEGRSLEEVTLPPELVEEAMYGLAVGIAHYRPRNEPWGRCAVVVVTVSAAALRLAGDARRNPRPG